MLDQAVRTRLESNKHMRDDVPVEVVQTYLETVLEGFITKLAAGEPVERLESMLDIVEQAVRHPMNQD